MGKIEIALRTFKTYVLEELLYTESDEWVRVESNRAVVGITDYAQRMLKDVVGVDLPKVGKRVSRKEPVITLESIKATAEVYAPVSGTIMAVNERLMGEPELLNRDPYGEGWLFVISMERPEELRELLTPQAYLAKIQRK
ncbi:MAG: glycine cleavage system protein GcvH [Acidilobaceae archaeon]|nr:glycine cleavage system protein GcvH [Acidilobaceae archaeon]MCX8165580.1 glycine cleavage system protein GcvH [Acidilobaceae archaeon]MDW7974007.1 glycine cleavage system protein GcvH [Sulfolobales archaeon]